MGQVLGFIAFLEFFGELGGRVGAPAHYMRGGLPGKYPDFEGPLPNLYWGLGAGTKTPEQTRRAIESWMPADIWAEVNLVLVGLGQEVQTEKSKLLRKCLACSTSVRGI